MSYPNDCKPSIARPTAFRAVTGTATPARARPHRSCAAAGNPLDWARTCAGAAAVFLAVSCSSGGDSGNDAGDSQIRTAEPTRVLNVTAAALEEGSDGATTELRFTVTLDAASAGEVRVDYTTAHVTTEAADFTGGTAGTVTIPPGATEATVAVGVLADTAFELDEEFTLRLGKPIGNATIGTGEAPGLIVNDDELAISVSNYWVGWIDVNLDPQLELNIDLLLDLSAFQLAELLAVSGRFDVFFEGALEARIPVASGAINLDLSNFDIDGLVAIRLQVPPSVTGLPLDQPFLILLSLDFDLPTFPPLVVEVNLPPPAVRSQVPQLSVDAAASVSEGSTGTTAELVFNARLDRALSTPIVLAYQTVDATATAPQDYVAASGTVTIPAGQKAAQFGVTVNGDDEIEGLEGFGVALDVVSGAVFLKTLQVIGLIFNDDLAADARSLRVHDGELIEGDAGTATMEFRVTLDAPARTPVQFGFATRDITARAGSDYEQTVGAATFLPNESELTISVPVHGDTLREPDERFNLLVPFTSANVAGAVPLAIGLIRTDDPPAQLRIDSASTPEGDAGTETRLTFAVTLSDALDEPLLLDFATRDDTALAGEDYEAIDRSIVIEAGLTSATVTVTVHGDDDPEDDEFLFLFVDTTSSSVTLPASGGRGTIVSDDPLARLGVADIALAEGDDGEARFVFTVTLSEALSAPLDLEFASADITATAGVDYTAVQGAVRIPAGDTAATIEVLVTGDGEPEDDEVFTLTLSTTSASVILLDGVAQGTILNDDDAAAGWAGAELVEGALAQALAPRVGFGPGGERHVIFQQGTALRHRMSTVPGVWEAPAEIARLPLVPGSSARLAVDTAGRALVAWIDGTVRASTYLAGVGWQAEPLPQDVSAEGLGLASDPASGEVIAIWSEPFQSNPAGVTSIWAAHFVPGAGWQDVGLVETFDDRHAAFPSVALAANGTAIAAFLLPPTARGAVDAVAYRRIGPAWVGPTILDAVDDEFASVPRIDINPAGHAAVVWYQTEPVPSGIARPSIYVNRYDAANDRWSGADLVEAVTTHSTRDPSVAIDGDGNVFVVWLQESPDYRTWDLMANRYDAVAGDWSGPRLLESDDTATGLNAIQGQQVVADDLGDALVVWVQNDGVLKNLRAARYSATDDDWLPPSLLEEIDTGDAATPHLAMDRGTGDAMVVWSQSDGSVRTIWANRYTAAHR